MGKGFGRELLLVGLLGLVSLLGLIWTGTLARWLWLYPMVVTIYLIWRLNKIRRSLASLQAYQETLLAGHVQKSYVKQGEADLDQLGAGLNQLSLNWATERAEKERSQSRLAALLSQDNLGFLLVERSGHLAFASSSLPFYLGLSAEQDLVRLPDLRWHELISRIQQVFLDGKARREELELGERLLEATFQPLGLSEGTVDQVLLLFYDLTQLRQLEEANLTFVANASHELRTPITSIRGFAETLLDLPEEQAVLGHRFLEIIHQDSLRLEALVSNLLVLARGQKVQPSSEVNLDLAQALADLLASLETHLADRDLTCQLSVAKLSYPISPEDFSHLFLNLMTNAIRYSHEGGQIWVRLWENDQSLCLQVRDQGIGIDEEHLPHLFDRFYRVNQGRGRDSGGTGLGLAIVKEVLDQLGGRIEVTSQLGQGSSFTIYLPKKQ